MDKEKKPIDKTKIKRFARCTGLGIIFAVSIIGINAILDEIRRPATIIDAEHDISISEASYFSQVINVVSELEKRNYFVYERVSNTERSVLKDTSMEFIERVIKDEYGYDSLAYIGNVKEDGSIGINITYREQLLSSKDELEGWNKLGKYIPRSGDNSIFYQWLPGVSYAGNYDNATISEFFGPYGELIYSKKYWLDNQGVMDDVTFKEKGFDKGIINGNLDYEPLKNELGGPSK